MTKPSNFPGRIKIRCEKALSRLQEQLNSGVKKEKKTNNIVPLTDRDTKRIKNQIETLKEKL